MLTLLFWTLSRMYMVLSLPRKSCCAETQVSPTILKVPGACAYATAASDDAAASKLSIVVEVREANKEWGRGKKRVRCI